MNIVYIISQIAGFIAFILSLIAYHQKGKGKIFQTMMIANVLDILHYILLGAYSGCITKVIALIRNEIIIIKEKIEKSEEYKLEFRTKKSLFDEIEKEIKKIHDYKVAEISYFEINGASKEFMNWIDKETK